MGIPLVDLHAQYLSIKEEIDKAIAEVIADAAFVGTSGNEYVRKFEEEFASYVGRRACVACANGTDSLETLLAAAGIGPGDEVLVPALSWISTSEAVSANGGNPVFVDILPELYSMDPRDAGAKITARTRAIIPVHLYGLPAQMDEICGLAAQHGLFLLEDCAQAHGAMFRGRQVGTFGDAASYSFFPGKNLGAWGDAGCMMTDDETLARVVRMIGQHGQTEKKHDHQREGRNSRMDGLQASILSVKLRHLDEWTTARRRIAARYRRALKDIVEGMQASPEDSESACHLFVVEVERRDEVLRALGRLGISAGVQYPTPLPLLPAYERMKHRPEDFPVAVRVAARVLSIPLYPELSEEQQVEVVNALADAVRPSRRAVGSRRLD
jgi:dTDP-4-amino-4,6-dideoxygalactose transaminase